MTFATSCFMFRESRHRRAPGSQTDRRITWKQVRSYVLCVQISPVKENH
jgi:hypothetical protein